MTRLGVRLITLDEGLTRDGASYLFALRVVPLVPFCVINLGMGLPRMPLGTYLLITFLGTLPGTVIYVNAGVQLAAIDPDVGLLSTELVVALTLIGVFPLVARRILALFRTQGA